MPKHKILLIDDDRELVELLTEYLASEGFELVSCFDGISGLEKAYDDSIDLILLDVMMPDLDGFATFQKLQANQQTKDIPVILLTAKIQDRDRQKFDSLGVSGVIAKPFEPLSLAEEVAQILGWA